MQFYDDFYRYFSVETANEADQLLEFFRVYREARKERKQDRHER